MTMGCRICVELWVRIALHGVGRRLGGWVGYRVLGYSADWSVEVERKRLMGDIHW